jgi:acyl-[acyl carrier protein]--UDP-N-acetylglucosamine O-acyltransferase
VAVAYSLSAQATVVVLGEGGHASVVIDALARCGRPWRSLPHHGDLREPGFGEILALGMGRRSDRKRAAGQFAPYCWATVVHPAAVVSPSASIGEGAQIMAGAIVQANAIIGKHAIINTGAQVDHGCRIGDFAHICPGAILCADVTVEEGAMVEPGQVVRRGGTVVV